MKRWIALVACILALLALTVGGTIAYYTTSGIATNVVTSGNLKAEIVEMALTEEGLVPFTDVIGVMPGTSVSKIVSVLNTGDHEAWVRVKVDFDVQTEEKMEVDLSLVYLDGLDTENWAYLDGWYYYVKPLAAGAETEPLFNAVGFSGKMPNEYQDCTVKVNVTMQAVQVANNGSVYTDAKGWPEV